MFNVLRSQFDSTEFPKKGQVQKKDECSLKVTGAYVATSVCRMDYYCQFATVVRMRQDSTKRRRHDKKMESGFEEVRFLGQVIH